MPITMHQSPAESTRTPENNCTYEAEAIIDGRRYFARSRRGAPFALARVLVAAGIPDRPVLVMHKGLRGEMRYRSLHRMAGRTVRESASFSAGVGRYEERPRFSDGEARFIACFARGGIFAGRRKGGLKNGLNRLKGPDP